LPSTVAQTAPVVTIAWPSWASTSASKPPRFCDIDGCGAAASAVGPKLRREAAHADLCAEDEYLPIADSRGWQLRVKLVGAAGDELRADIRQEQREPCDRREIACFGYRHC